MSTAPVPSFKELALANPIKEPDSLVTRIGEDICRICCVKFNSAQDVTTDSPWMGCVGKDGESTLSM